MGNRYKSPIPVGVVENTVSEYREQGDGICLRRVECTLNGVVVGERFYDDSGALQVETPLRDGKKHGIEYSWADDGSLELAEPYVDGLISGTAKQWDSSGRLLGTYSLKHGTGLDIWRTVLEGGIVFISEIHSMRNGRMHGFEWSVNEDQCSVWWEKHWCDSQWHGIERQWSEHGRLARGYPKYWINSQQVNRRKYVRCAAEDPTLPPFREKDQSPTRILPIQIACDAPDI